MPFKTRFAPAMVVLSLVAAAATACSSSASSAPASAAADCKPAHQFSTLHKGTLTVAAFDLPPFGAVQDGKLVGVDGDILGAIAKRECLTVTVNLVATASVIPSVQEGRADVAAPDWYRTAARAQVVGLTDPLYLDQMALVSKTGISDISQLKGKSVGTVNGYLWDNDLQSYLGSGLKIYASAAAEYEDFKLGRLDVVVDSYGSAIYTTKGTTDKVVVAKPFAKVAASLTAAQSAFPVAKGDTALLSAFNADIAELRTSGQLAAILTKDGLPASAAVTGAARLIGG